MSSWRPREDQHQAAADHRRADRALGHQGLDRRDQGCRAAADDAARYGEAGRGRAREAGEDHPRRRRVRGRQAADRGGHGYRPTAERTATSLSTDPHRNWGRAEHRHRLPNADRHDATAHRAAGRQRPGVDGTGEDLTPLLASGDVALDVATVVLLYLWPPIQRAVARVIPVRPGSPVMYLTVVLGLLLVAQQVGAQVQPGPPLTIGDLLAQDVPLLVLCFVGVGIFVRRSPRQTVE